MTRWWCGGGGGAVPGMGGCRLVLAGRHAGATACWWEAYMGAPGVRRPSAATYGYIPAYTYIPVGIYLHTRTICHRTWVTDTDRI